MPPRGQAMSAVVSSADERQRLLAGNVALGALPPAALALLAQAMEAVSFAAGETIVAEGEPGERLYVIASGRAEVAARAGKEAVPLAALGPGDLFGEIALLGGASAARQATVTALTPVRALSLARGPFEALLRAHPEVRVALEGIARQLLMVKFLRLASPFASLDRDQLLALAARVETLFYSAGSRVLRQGDTGNTAYLVHRGRLEVRQAGDEEERAVATLGPGALFGEAALLTDAPRNASVVALEDCELLALRREDLLAVLSRESVRFEVLRLLRIRERPRRRDGVQIYRRVSADGSPVAVLKDSGRGIYHLLSPLGDFVWEHLDGSRNLRDLVLEYFLVSKQFAPDAIAQLVCGLADAGLITTGRLRADVPATTVAQPRVRGMRWQASVEGFDHVVGALYRAGGRYLYTPAAKVAAAILALAGYGAVALKAPALDAAALAAASGLWLLPAFFLSLLWHELAHALTVKAFGRESRRIGVGLRGVAPVAFVDISDMWLEGRWPRIAVSLAGPYSNLVLGGAAGVAALAAPSPHDAALWLFAWLSALLALFNLSPFYLCDGHQALDDWIDGRRDASLRRRLYVRWGAAFIVAAGALAAVGYAAWAG